MAKLLEVRDLILHYADPQGEVRAVDGVSFDIAEPGMALGIVGESGCGKSSTANALMRHLPGNTARFEGDVRLAGELISAYDAQRFHREVKWKRMALVPQGAMNSLNPVMRIGSQIIEPYLVSGRRPRAELRRKAEALLEQVGLPASVYTLYPHELSGGMKQRIMIASALIHDPSLLIMDEPTSALDVSVQAQIMNLLKDLVAEGLSIIFITHDIALASDICDQLAVVYAGQLAEIGAAEQVLRAPAHPYARKLLASIPRLQDGTVPEFIPGAPPDLRDLPGGCRFQARCDRAWALCQQQAPPPQRAPEGQTAWCWLHDPQVSGPEEVLG